jgi:hypothetical protein
MSLPSSWRRRNDVCAFDWNRYPGARFDSESWTYGYSFSEELLKEWDWKEHFSPQPDTLEYLNRVADKFDLRRDEFDILVYATGFDGVTGHSTASTFAVPAVCGCGTYGPTGRAPISASWPMVSPIC